MAQRPPHKHHYIPAFYTKWWAGADGCVERFTKHRSVVSRRVHPNRVGWQENLYQIPESGPQEEQVLEEQFFRQLDNSAATTLRKLNAVAPQPLTSEEASAWSVFIMSLLHRTPEYLRATKAVSRSIWHETLPDLKDQYPSLRGPDDPETFDQYVTERDPIETEKSLLWNLPELIANPRIGQFLVEMRWMHFNIPSGTPPLLLSDNPLARTDGIKLPGGHLAMPISPRRLFVAAWGQEALSRLERTPIKQLARNMNQWTVESARHFVVATDLTQARFIENHFGLHPKPPLLG